MRTKKTKDSVNIAIMTSVEESNTENIIQYFEPFLDVNVACVISNKENSDILKKIKKYKIKTYTTKWYKKINKILINNNVHYIVLSNYFDKIPPNFCEKYKWKIINIHPSLLPKYENKYGDHIHQSVKKNGDNKSGITIHFANNKYNSNSIIFQKEIKIDKNDTWQEIKSRVEDLEYKFYPKIIEKIIKETYEHLYKLHTN